MSWEWPGVMGVARCHGGGRVLQEEDHKQGRTLRVFPRRIDVQVVQHIADIHIVEHCGGVNVEYHWVMEVTQEGRSRSARMSDLSA